MALTTAQIHSLSQLWAQQQFVAANITANFTVADLQAAAQAIDNAFDTTLNAAVVAVGGGLTIAQGLNAIIPAPFNTATVAQKSILVCYVIMKRSGII